MAFLIISAISLTSLSFVGSSFAYLELPFEMHGHLDPHLEIPFE